MSHRTGEIRRPVSTQQCSRSRLGRRDGVSVRWHDGSDRGVAGEWRWLPSPLRRVRHMSSSIITSASEGSHADSTSDPGCDVGMLPATLRIGCRFEFDADCCDGGGHDRRAARDRARSGRRRAVRPTCGHGDHDLRRRLRQPLPAHDVARRAARTFALSSTGAQRRRVRRRRPGRLRGRGRRAAGRDAGVPPPEPILPVRRAGGGRPSSGSDRRRPAGPGSTPSRHGPTNT